MGAASGICARAASMAAAAMSARITMPAPPPAGVSSTERCLSVAKSRMSTMSSAQMPSCRALPARLKPSGPGNISGNRVSTVARQGDGIGLYSIIVRRDEGEASGRNVDLRHRRVGEGHDQAFAARGRANLDEIAGAEIQHRHDGADRLALQVDHGEADEVGVIPLIGLPLRQPRAGNIELGAVERLGRLARGDALDAGDQRLGRDPDALDLDAARAGLVVERAVAREAARLLGIGANADLARAALARRRSRRAARGPRSRPRLFGGRLGGGRFRFRGGLFRGGLGLGSRRRAALRGGLLASRRP